MHHSLSDATIAPALDASQSGFSPTPLNPRRPPTLPESPGGRLRRYREEAALTQGALAAAAGCSPATICRLELSATRPQLRTLAKIRDALQRAGLRVTMADLLGR